MSVAANVQAAKDTAVRITKSDCIQIVEHYPSADVAYQLGIDVRGLKVVPADLEASHDLRNFVPKVIECPVALNPLKGGAACFGETSLEVGKVGLYMKSRRSTFNGKPLTRSETRRISKKFRERLGETK